MDHFMEEVVVKQHKGMQELLYVLSNVMMVVTALLGMTLMPALFASFSIPTLVITVLMLGSAVLLFLRKDRLRT
ncbi:MAG: hypothetical protein RSA65_09470, partial [Clostridia bacterium]